jgi:iron complex outermembrane receptor protein
MMIDCNKKLLRAAMLVTTATVFLFSGGAALAEQAVAPDTAGVAPAPTPDSGSANPSARAAAPAGDTSGDIVVTARLRKDTLLQVPVAISAISGAKLAQTAATDLSQISNLVPNLIISRGSSGNGGTIALRGVASTGNDSGIESSVAVNIDGISITRGYITQVAFFDLGQMEVLKGPQALFYGKNSPGGVIVMHSAEPTDHFFASLKTGYEINAKEIYTEGVVSGPLTSTLTGRLAVRYDTMKGWLHNTAGPLANPFDPANLLPGVASNGATSPDSHTLVGRISLNWNPVSDFSAKLRYLHSRYSDNDATGYQQSISCAAGATHPTTLGVQDPYGDCTADNNRTSGQLPANVIANYPILKDYGHSFTRVGVDLASLQLDYDAGPVKLTSISGYFRMRDLNAGAFDYSTYALFYGVTGEHIDTLSQEFRALTQFKGWINFAAGAYYEHYDRSYYGVTRVAPVLRPDPTTGYDASVAPAGDVKSQTASGFVQAILTPSEHIEIAGGARYTNETKNAVIGNTFVNQWVNPATGLMPSASFRPVGDNIVAHFHDTAWSPEATVSWKINPEQTLYGAYRSGYKSGGFSGTVSILRSSSAATLEFGSETAHGFEVGYKARLFDRRVRLNLTGYDFRYDNLQRAAYDVATNSFLVRNAAGAITRGIEGDVSFKATHSLSLNLTGSYNDAHYKNFSTAPCYTGQTAAQGCIGQVGTTARVQNLSGTQLARAPKWVWTGGFEYERPIGGDLRIAFAGDGKHSSGYITEDDADPSAVQRAYWTFNASVRLIGPEDKWELAVIGRDLSNQYVILNSSAKPGGSPGDIIGFVDRPRQINIQATMNF